MRNIDEIKKEIISEVKLEFPDWNRIARLAGEGIFVEDNIEYGGTYTKKPTIDKRRSCDQETTHENSSQAI